MDAKFGTSPISVPAPVCWHHLTLTAHQGGVAGAKNATLSFMITDHPFRPGVESIALLPELCQRPYCKSDKQLYRNNTPPRHYRNNEFHWYPLPWPAQLQSPISGPELLFEVNNSSHSSVFVHNATPSSLVSVSGVSIVLFFFLLRFNLSPVVLPL
jgi:hypothetical protein